MNLGNRTSGAQRSRDALTVTRACVCTFLSLWYHYCSKCHFLASGPLVTADCASSQTSDLNATVLLPRRPISRRRRDAPSDSRLPVCFFLFLFILTDRPPTWPNVVLLVYLSITWRARNELENYTKSEDALGESPVDRPRRLEIVGDPRTMSIVPAILQGPFTPQIF